MISFEEPDAGPAGGLDGDSDPFLATAADGPADTSLWDHYAAAADPVDTALPADPADPEISVPGPAGVVFSGPATYDATGDGANDTVVMQSPDGTVTSATDYDGDGVADQVTVVGPDGTVTVSAADEEGRWRPIASGRVTEDGGIVFDRAVPAPIAGGGAEQPTDEPTAEPVALTGPAGISYIDDNGIEHRLGVPDQDLDGDGVAESVAARTGDGHLLVVSDADADGVADRLIDVDERSGAVTWAAAPVGPAAGPAVGPAGSAEWDITNRGHVDLTGNLVVDQPGEQVVVQVDGRPFDAGRAAVDADGDGIADTVALSGPGGSVQYYQDTDGDGFADRAWTADSAGNVTARYILDVESGSWAAVGT